MANLFVRRTVTVVIVVVVLIVGFFLGSYTTPKVATTSSTTIYETKNVTTTETITETTTITTGEPIYNFFSLTVDRVSHDASGCRITVSYSTRSAYIIETNQRFKQIIGYLNSSTVEGITSKCVTTTEYPDFTTVTGISIMYCSDYSLTFDLKGAQERQVKFDVCKDGNVIWFENGCESYYKMKTSPDFIAFIENVLTES